MRGTIDLGNGPTSVPLVPVGNVNIGAINIGQLNLGSSNSQQNGTGVAI